MYETKTIVDTELIKTNPRLYGKTPLEIFDETIKVLT